MGDDRLCKNEAVRIVRSLGKHEFAMTDVMQTRAEVPTYLLR